MQHAVNGLSVWSWNCNGFDGASTDIVNFLETRKPDVLALIDSQLTDLEKVKQCLGRDWKILHESRPHNVHKRKLYGGITVLWRSSNVRVCRESGYPKGALSFIVQDAAGQRKPVAVIVLYSPPVSSRLNRYGSKWSQDILAWAEIEVARLWQKYGFVSVLADFNWRLFKTFRRRTEDSGSSASNASTRTEIARQWHVRTRLRPLYGQRGQLPGVFTSRTTNGMAEVDGVSICKDIPNGWSVEALEPPPWEEYSTRDGVHRPVGCIVVSPTVVAAQGAVPDRNMPTDERKNAKPLPYGSPEYHNMAPEFARCIRQFAVQLQSGTVDLETGLPALAASLVELQNRHFSHSETSPSAPPPQDDAAATVVFSANRAPKGRSKPRTLASAAALRRLKQRNPTVKHRRFQHGTKAPPAVVALLEERRKLVKKALADKARLRRNKPPLSPSDKAYCELDQSIKDSLAKAKVLRAEAETKLRQAIAKGQNAECERLAHLVRHHPHRFFRELYSRIPQPFETYDESAGPSPELSQQFRDFFAGLLQRAANPPESVPEEYRGSVPTADESTTHMLLAQITWQEVYSVIYPAHKLSRRDPCLPNCKLCNLFAEQVNVCEPGDTNVVQPEHRPRLWTSKSAGPDGVYAETFRWVCPEAHEDRHPYRKEVATSLATIFNAILESGATPLCPQFSDAAMTALYKGTGDRDQATNYRGICVPNVIAKLFGLVMGTRLSHWAVANGLISPAQAGFVAMHGCEYHVFHS